MANPLTIFWRIGILALATLAVPVGIARYDKAQQRDISYVHTPATLAEEHGTLVNLLHVLQVLSRKIQLTKVSLCVLLINYCAGLVLVLSLQSWNLTVNLLTLMCILDYLK